MVTRKLFPVLAIVGLLATGCTSDENPLAPGVGEDTTPPAAPQSVVYRSDNLGARLTWGANGEPDLAGYNVYRFDPDPSRENAYVKVNSAVVSSTTFNIPIYQGESLFRVKSIDKAGNESAWSSVTSVFFGEVWGDIDDIDGIGSKRGQ